MSDPVTPGNARPILPANNNKTSVSASASGRRAPTKTLFLCRLHHATNTLERIVNKDPAVDSLSLTEEDYSCVSQVYSQLKTSVACLSYEPYNTALPRKSEIQISLRKADEPSEATSRDRKVWIRPCEDGRLLVRAMPVCRGCTRYLEGTLVDAPAILWMLVHPLLMRLQLANGQRLPSEVLTLRALTAVADKQVKGLGTKQCYWLDD